MGSEQSEHQLFRSITVKIKLIIKFVVGKVVNMNYAASTVAFIDENFLT